MAPKQPKPKQERMAHVKKGWNEAPRRVCGDCGAPLVRARVTVGLAGERLRWWCQACQEVK